jgi:sugar phosphate isomerase/epimerase
VTQDADHGGSAARPTPASGADGRSRVIRIPPIKVGMSTAAVYPEGTAAAFALAAELGYDGIEVLVTAEQLSQDVDRIADLIQTFGVPVLSVHSPCLLVTARVWSNDPLVKLTRSVDMAERLGADTVVVHPPFVWQRAAAAIFAPSIAELQERTPVRIAVENMFPVKVRGAIVNSYRPHWNPVAAGHSWFTLDLSHTATSQTNALELADAMGERLGHLHLADGSGSARDEHLVPGRGGQPCAEILELLVRNDFRGSIVVEITTRGVDRSQREIDLAQALSFARLHLAAAI